ISLELIYLKINSTMSQSEIVLKSMAVLNGIEKVPPSDTPATGRLLVKVIDDTLHYQLETNNISDISAANLHLGTRGHNGPVIANLLSKEYDDSLVRGKLRKENLTGNLEGVPLYIFLDEIAH